MNPTDTTLPRQANLDESTVVPYDDPSWIREPVCHNGRWGDAEFWEDGPAIPPDAVIWPAGRAWRPPTETEADDDFGDVLTQGLAVGAPPAPTAPPAKPRSPARPSSPKSPKPAPRPTAKGVRR